MLKYDINEVGYVLTSPPVKIKTARMLKYDINEVGYVLTRQTYCGEWERSYIRNKKCIPKEIKFEQQYFETIPLKKPKIDNFIHLSKFIKRPQNIAFYKAFISMLQKKPVGDSSSQDKVEVIDDDNSSGESDPEENC
ncbi:hypothetical protein QE152_g26191 [Popillia japonica]|uniref:Uncharacterized protein n=1 Tax=Popillia japonica TaxID=7064 RepID=A0AAW1JY63_POPJA